MGKISKFANLYDKNGVLLRKVDKNGLKNLTLKEVEDLVDKLGTEKDENGKIKDPEGFNNASAWLMRMYTDPKYANEKAEMMKKIQEKLNVSKEDKEKTLKETAEELEELEKTNKVDTNDDEYVDYEEVA